MAMNPKQKAEHILKVCSDTLPPNENKKDALEWVNNQKNKTVHSWLNTLCLNQEQINKYWSEVEDVIKTL